MRIWMEEHYGEKDHFALKITLYLLLLLTFAIMMPVGVTWLALYFKWPITEVTLTTCIVDVILIVGCTDTAQFSVRMTEAVCLQ